MNRSKESIAYRLIRMGRFASIAPTMLQIHIESHHGNDCFVTCARMMRDTWCANCKPHEHRKGTKSAELRICESSNEGELSQNTSMATDSGNGRSKSRGVCP